MDLSKLAPGKVAQYYALLAWNGMKAEDAYNMVETNSFEELNNTTYAGDSVEAAKKGIEKYLLNGSCQLNNSLITGEKAMGENDFLVESNVLCNSFNSQKEICDAIIKILAEIHDKWVVDNAKKFDRDKDNNDKRLYQHLPTALIGVDEVAKDLMFLAPIMEVLGYPVGKMTESEWGAFIPSRLVVDAYQRYVEAYKEANVIKTEEDLADHIAHITETYDALKVGNAPSGKESFAEQRSAYMAEAHRVEKLVSKVKDLNKESFDLESESESSVD